MRRRRPPRHGAAAAILAGALALAVPAAPWAGNEPAPPATDAGSEAPRKVRKGERHRGVASYYGSRFDGRRTASGEVFDSGKLTAAHRSLPLGTRVRVTDNQTGRAVVVRVNDRGPYVPGRTIDLSHRAGEVLGITREGLADVTIEVVGGPGA